MLILTRVKRGYLRVEAVCPKKGLVGPRSTLLKSNNFTIPSINEDSSRYSFNCKIIDYYTRRRFYPEINFIKTLVEKLLSKRIARF